MNTIEQLKRLVIQAKNLSEPFNYFFDLMDAGAFTKMNSHRPVKEIHQHTELRVVTELVQKETSKRLGKSIKWLVPLFHEVPEHYFFHGTCLPDDFNVALTAIYFSDVKTGLFAIAGAKTDMMRFSLMKSSDMSAKQ